MSARAESDMTTAPALVQAPTAPSDIEARLLPVVESLLFEHGYAGFNIRDVAKRAEMGSATIYKYFGSKELLALRILRDQDAKVAEAVRPVVAAIGPAKQQWRSVYDGLLSYYDRDLVAAVVQNVAMPTNTWFLPESRWPVSAVLNILRELIARGRRTGELDPAISDNQILAAHYMHVVREVRLWRSRDMRWRLADRVDQFFPIIWKTISTPQTPPR